MPSIQFVNSVRSREIDLILSRHHDLFAGKSVLELGSGGGAQLLAMRRVCSSAVGIDVAVCSDVLTEVSPYDGRHIPFPDSSFDLIFSSHVIEHIKHETEIHSEMHRILRPSGLCMHVVPSAFWRFLSFSLHYPALAKKAFMKLRRVQDNEPEGNNSNGASASQPNRWRSRLSYAFLPQRHGEFGNWLTEPLHFRQASWRKRFKLHGWRVLSVEPFGVLNSGHYLLKERLSFAARCRVARILGAGAFLFILAPSR